MKSSHFDEYDKTLKQAEMAIADSDHRAKLLQEMCADIGLTPEAVMKIFAGRSAEEIKPAERELLYEIKRQRERQPQHPNDGKRPKKPTMMRGQII